MKNLKHLFTVLLLLCSVVFNAQANTQTFSDWISTNTSDDSSSQNSYTLNVVDGSVLTFDWSVSSESNYDKLIIMLDGSEILNKSGELSGSYTHTFTAVGTHTLISKYTKDYSVSKGGDYGKIYNIKLTSPNGGKCGDNATWELNDGTLTIAGTGAMDNYTYSSPAPWDDKKSSIKRVVINGGITSIGEYAFYYISYLEKLTIPATVATIGSYAFYNCSKLKTVYNNSDLKLTAGSEEYGYVAYYANAIIKDSDDVQGDYIFRTTDEGHILVAYTGNDSIISLPASYNGGSYAIDKRVFRNCRSIKSITIPNKVTAIDENAFEGCTNLKEVHINSLEAWCNIDFGNCYSTPVYHTQKLHLNGEVVTSVSFPTSVKEVKDYTFYNNLSLTSVTIHDDITGIGSYAFYNCYNINGNIIIPSKVQNIGDYAFYYCNITSISIPEGVTNIGDYAFYHCDDLSGELIIPGSVKKIGKAAFSDCIKISSVKIPNGVEIIGSSAFSHCRFSSITIPESVKEIGDFAFFETSIQEVVFEDGESTLLLGNQKYSDGIGGGMFEYVPVKTVYIGRNLTFSRRNDSYNRPRSNALFAHWYASSYSSLQTAIIGPKVTSLPEYIFEDCKELKTVISFIPADELCAFNKTAEGFLPSEAILYVPINAKDAYSAIADWKDFGIINEFVEKDGFVFSITSNEDATLEVINYVGSESTIIIPDKLEISGKEFSVTSIKSNTFHNCTYLENITIPNSVENIGYEAFYNTAWYNKQPDGCVYAGKVLYSYKGSMPENTSIVVKDGTLGITSSALSNGCITSVTLPSSLKNIGTDAFLNSYNLDDVYISDLASWCNIDFGNLDSNPLRKGGNLYLNGEKVTNLVIPEGVASIKNYAFCSYRALTSVTIPESVTNIGNYAFNYCTGLTGALSLPASLTNIGEQAFCNCTGLTGTLSLPASLTNIGKLAFYDCTGLTGTLSLPASLTNIGERAFYNCSGLTGNISIPGGVENINASTFYNCSGITDVVIDDGVANICESAFYGCSGLTSITIPASVTSIGNDVFRGCKALKDVRIEDGTETLSLGYCSGINYGLFYDCPLETLYLGRNLSFNTYYGYSPFYNKSKLTSVTIGGSVTSIGDYAFYYCTSLINVEIPDGVTSIGEYAFSGCSGLISVEIPNSLTSIGENAFSSCYNLTSIVIPNSLTSIGNCAFNNCYDLKTIYNFSSLNISAGSTNHGYVAYYANKVINAPGGGFVGNFVFKVTNSDAVLCQYLGNDDKIVLPADYKGSKYSVGENVFKNNTTITTVVIPDGVTSIGKNAFYGCTNLKTVKNFSSLDISAGSTDHGYVAYYTNYVENNTNRGVVGNFIFETINAGSYYEYHQLVEYIEEIDVVQRFDDVTIDAWNSVSRSITVEAGEVLSLKWESEYDLEIEIIKDYDRVTSGYLSTDYFYKFTESGNYEIRFYSYLSGKIYDFKTSRPLEVVLPNDYKGKKYFIADDAFSNTKISSVIISDGVTSIGISAFEGCKNLTSIVIPNSVKSIGSSAYNGCSGLKEVHISDLVAWCGIDFGNYSANPLYSAKKLYLNGDLVTELVIPEGAKEVKNSAFYNCSGLTSVVIPNSVTSIGMYAFDGCSSLTSIEIPNSVKSIGWGAFAYCTGLKEVHISDLAAWCRIDFGNNEANPLYYAGNLYLKGELLTKLTIPESVTKVKNYAFYNCSALTNVVIPNSVTSIGYSAFSGCFGLTNVVIPNSVTSIRDGAFSGCSGLTSVEIPNSVTSIGERVFYGCSSLTSITSLIPADALFAVYSYTFYNVDKNTCTLYVPYGAKETYASTEGWSEFANIVELEKPITEVNIIINQYGNATFCSDLALDFSEVEGLKAYCAIGYKPSTQVVTLARVMTTGEGQGIFIKGEPGEYTVPAIDDFDEYTLNMLVGTLEQTVVNSTDGEMSNYKFTILPGDETPMFYPFEDNTPLSAGKAYLQIPTAWLPVTAQKSLSIRFDDGETTDVDELKGENGEVKTIYDMQGRVVENPTSGIYIIDGKKVLVK